LAECQVRRKLKTGRNTGKFTNSVSGSSNSCPDFANFPERGRELAAILGIIAGKPLRANGLPWIFVPALSLGQGIIREPAFHFGTEPMVQRQIRQLPRRLAACRRRTCRFCPFPDIFIQPRTQVYKDCSKEYCLALIFYGVTVSNPLAGQKH
jgi:hypothetical protein